MLPSEIIIATTNPNKQEQIIEFFGYWVNQFNISPPQLLLLQDSLDEKIIIDVPEENGSSFKENALIKAKYYSQFTSLPILCDDSGLVVPTLGGEPGIYSASYAGNERNSEKNNQLLLHHLTHKTDRFAYLTSLSILYTQKEAFIGIGNLYGEIAQTMHSPGKGFGYEPIFYLPEYKQYLNEISNATRLKISHRSLSIQSLLGNMI